MSSLLSKKTIIEHYWKTGDLSLTWISIILLAKALATRRKKVLPNIIDSDQTGYVRNGYIGENIRNNADLIEYTNIINIPGLILLVDFEKAFDTVKWTYLDKVLEQHLDSEIDFDNGFTSCTLILKVVLLKIAI